MLARGSETVCEGVSRCFMEHVAFSHVKPDTNKRKTAAQNPRSRTRCSTKQPRTANCEPNTRDRQRSETDTMQPEAVVKQARAKGWCGLSRLLGRHKVRKEGVTLQLLASTTNDAARVFFRPVFEPPISEGAWLPTEPPRRSLNRAPRPSKSKRRSHLRRPSYLRLLFHPFSMLHSAGPAWGFKNSSKSAHLIVTGSRDTDSQTTTSRPREV